MNLANALSSLPNTDKNVVSVLSGGLDSSIMTYILYRKYGAEKVFALSFDYNQKQKYELVCASRTCAHLNITHKILDLSILGNIVQSVSANISGTNIQMPTIKDVLADPQPKTYVPFRNMILNALAFSYAEANKASHVFTGLQVHDQYGYWDTSQAFVNNMNTVASLNRTHKVEIVAPFSHLSKHHEILIARELGNVKFEDTFTCYDPTEDNKACGKCPSCSERIQNFIKAKVIDPIQYNITIPWEKYECVQL
jgi:7-cyano-7-deazaguanine synthase